MLRPGSGRVARRRTQVLHTARAVLTGSWHVPPDPPKVGRIGARVGRVGSGVGDGVCGVCDSRNSVFRGSQGVRGSARGVVGAGRIVRRQFTAVRAA